MNNKKTVMFVGSDLSPPYTTMEAKMVGQLIASLSSNYVFKRISINVSANKQEQGNTSAVNGIQIGPMALRKMVYGVQLFTTYVRQMLNPDISIVHFIWVGFDPLTQIMIKLAHWQKKKVIVTVLNKHSPMARYAGADEMVFHSPYSKQELVTQHSYLSSAHVIPPPVKQQTFETVKPPYFVSASGPRTVEQIKIRGFYLLMDAMKLLQEQGSDIQLQFVGRWIEGADLLESIVKDRGLNNVSLSHDYVTDIDGIIGQSTGLIIPYVGGSIGDVPLSALESLAFGTPVITTHGFHVASEQEQPAITICDQKAETLAHTMIQVSQQGEVADICRGTVKMCSLTNFITSYDVMYEAL
ncbi:MAG: glycosyltransferase [Methylococcales bacterium]